MTLATAPIEAEVIPSFEDAEAHTNKLVAAAQDFVKTHNNLMELVIVAYRENVYVALEFEQSPEGWRAYLDKYIGKAFRGLKGADRQAAVASLTSVGMSTRAIASVLDVGVGTVHRDQQAAPVPDGTPTETKGLDGKTYSKSEEQPEKTFQCDKCGKRKPIDTQLNEIRDGKYCQRCADEMDGEAPKLTAAEQKKIAEQILADAHLLADRIREVQDSPKYTAPVKRVVKEILDVFASIEA